MIKLILYYNKKKKKIYYIKVKFNNYKNNKILMNKNI